MRTQFMKAIKMVSLVIMVLLVQIGFAQQSAIFGKLDAKPSPNLTETGPILWNQIDEPGTGFIVSQEFTNAGNETETSIAADDFYVPEGESWTIGSIAFVGSFFDQGVGPADAFNLVFYNDAPPLFYDFLIYK